ncbi:hypothetical protein LA76x_1655 [Lysobacter antibioticus]|uniref:Uncharacterized protein n=1 Tax=Lysobacter antibioticus TaxID=84531 RepID=A0A0S2F8L8_LYSAN|nr:hypothetical protein LA76x_1655 [Lysobacter antibioticus]
MACATGPNQGANIDSVAAVTFAIGAFGGLRARSGRSGAESGCRRRAGTIGPRGGGQAGGPDERDST